MATNQVKISDIFEQGTCSVCGSSEINQYFGINDSFIEYDTVFYSFREILAVSLDLQINHSEETHVDICLDCKDKVIKFYHFKRRVREIQKKILPIRKKQSSPKKNSSKIVHNIVEIVENYTAKAKCAISTIRIDASNNKLIIESKEHSRETTTPFKNLSASPLVPIKPTFNPEATFKKEPNLSIDEFNGNDEDSSEDLNDEDFLAELNEENSAGTSTSVTHSRSQNKVKLQSQEFQSVTNFEKWRTYQEKRRKRMELLKLPDNQDLYERHKAQARERTRRYRAKLRQQKMMEENLKQTSTESSQCHRTQLQQPPQNETFPFLNYAEIKLEEASDDDIQYT